MGSQQSDAYTNLVLAISMCMIILTSKNKQTKKPTFAKLVQLQFNCPAGITSQGILKWVAYVIKSR